MDFISIPFAMFHAAELLSPAHAAVDAGEPALPGIRFRGQMWTGLVSNGLARIEKWFRRGAWDDGQVMLFDDDWCFPYGGEHLPSVEIWSQGQIYPSEKSPEPIVSLVTPLSLKPAETEVFCGRTADNGYRVEWRNAHPNRNDGQIADAAIELRRNGDCIVTENGVTTVVPYDVPFAHNGFGQDADWVRANFTNAEEILAVGYMNWAEDQIGYDQLNGLYLFTAYFADDPPEATEVYVGDYSVAVTNAGEYVFVLEKGSEYEFGTWPNDAGADYWAQDDMGDDAPLLMSWWGYWDSFGTWTEDGGWSRLYYPDEYLGNYFPGICCWLPTLRGSPDVSHLGPEAFPMTFEAVLTDYPEGKSMPIFRWGSDDENIRILSPNSRQTLVTVDSMPSWSSSDLLVTAEFGRNILTSELVFHYGRYEEPQVHLSLKVPEGIAVAGERQKLTAEFRSDIQTNGCLKLRCTSGLDNITLWSDLTNGVSVAPNNSWNVNSVHTFSCYLQAESVSEYEGVEFEYSFSPDNGGNKVETATSTAFECYTQPVDNGFVTGLQVYNPSYLNPQSNAVFRIQVNPDTIPDSGILWNVAGGTATFIGGNTGKEVKILGTCGMVDIGIGILGVADERMHFKAKVR